MRFGVLAVGLLSGFTALGIPAQSAPPEPRSTTIAGVVFDSLEMRGLPDALVQISGTGGQSFTQSATTDTAGRFTFSGVPVGTFLLGFFHPKLDSLSLTSPTLRVDVRTDQPVEARLAVPSPRTIVRALCGPKAITDSTGLLLGYVRGADNSMPRANGTVSVQWVEVVIEKNSIRRDVPKAEATTSSSGLFAMCGIPMGVPIMLQAGVTNDSSGSFEVSLPPAGLLHRDIYIAPFARTKVASSDSAPAVDLLRGTGRLRGRVLGVNGRPVASARATVWGTGLEAVTDSDGQFSLVALPPGTHTLEVRAVGFSPARQPVDIVQGAPGAAAIELTNLGITLDTVRVVAQHVFSSRREADIEQRLRKSLGHVVGAAEIEKWQPQVMTDLLRRIPGVQILPGKRSGEDVYMRGGQAILGSGMCRPDIRVDGSLVVNDENFPINFIVNMDQIRAIEVYAHATLVPVEYQTTSGCGVIVIWTGPRRK
jgi:hypothetical protein